MSEENSVHQDVKDTLEDLRDQAVCDDCAEQAADAGKKEEREEPRRLPLDAACPTSEDDLRNGADKEDDVGKQADCKTDFVLWGDYTVVENNFNPVNSPRTACHENDEGVQVKKFAVS